MPQISGKIKDFSLPRILVNLNRNRKTGVLTVKTPAFTKKIYLDKGDAIFASSTNEDDRLGEMLVKAGKIRMEQYERSVELLKSTGRRQGAILVELGYLTPQELIWGVKHQVKEIIYSLFQLEDAQYEFEEGETPTNEIITLKMSTGNLIYEGVKRIDNLTRIKEEMPNMTTVLKLSTDPVSLLQDIVLSAQDERMLFLIDGKKTIKDLIDSSSDGSFEALKTLYVLMCVGIVEEQDGVREQTMGEPLKDLRPTPGWQESFIKRVDEIYSNLDRLSPSELLGINENSDMATIENNYYNLVKEFHPDHVNITDLSVKDKLVKIFESMTDAYKSMKEDFKRGEYSNLPKKVQEEAIISKYRKEQPLGTFSKEEDISPSEEDREPEIVVDETEKAMKEMETEDSPSGGSDSYLSTSQIEETSYIQQVSPHEKKEASPKEILQRRRLKILLILLPLFAILTVASILLIISPREGQKITPSSPVAKQDTPLKVTHDTLHTLELIATDMTWLSVNIDDKGTKDILLKPGERIKWTAKKGFSLKIGNAAGIKLLFDGKEVGRLGEKGQVVKLRLPSTKLS
ncbi:MAG: RodZ domain-containing protein [Nitrospirota bacterium]